MHTPARSGRARYTAHEALETPRRRHTGKWFAAATDDPRDCPAYAHYSAFPSGFAGWQAARRPRCFWTCCGGELPGDAYCIPAASVAQREALDEELAPLRDKERQLEEQNAELRRRRAELRSQIAPLQVRRAAAGPMTPRPPQSPKTSEHAAHHLERAEYQASAKRSASQRSARMQAQLDKRAADAAAAAYGKPPTAEQEQADHNTVGARLLAALKELTPANLERLCQQAEGLSAKQRFTCATLPVAVGGCKLGGAAAVEGRTCNVQSREIALQAAGNDDGGAADAATLTRTVTVDGVRRVPEYDAHTTRLLRKVSGRTALAAGLQSSWEEQWTNETESRDPSGERAVKQLGKALRSRALKFTDPDFPPTDSSLFRDSSKRGGGGASTFRKDKDPFLAGVDKLVWKRAAEIGNPEDKVVVFQASGEDAIQPDDISQGRLGDCYFLAACAAVAGQKVDTLIRDIIIEDHSDEGLYGVKFYVNGKWLTVIVDDYFPCVIDEIGTAEQSFRPLFASSQAHEGQESGVKEVWPMVLEKAWAKLHGSYEATAGGQTADTLNYLTGGVVSRIEIEDDEEHGTNDEWEEVKALAGTARLEGATSDDEKAFLSCALKTGVTGQRAKEAGLIDGHAYSLLSVVEACGVKLLELRNPWGSFEWTGDYGDDSDKWTPELKKACNFSKEDDGTFWMCWEDFLLFFDEIEVCNPFLLASPKASEDGSVRCDTVCGSWVAGQNAGGRHGCSTFKHNPSFTITAGGLAEAKAKEEITVLITLYQPDRRGQKHEEDGWADLYLYLCDPSVPGEDGSPAQKKVLHLWRRQEYAEVKLEAGKTYVLTPTAWAPGVEGRFWITCSAPYCEVSPVVASAGCSDEDAAEMALQECRHNLCKHCGEDFSGEKRSYVDVDGRQLHAGECYEAYREATAEKCVVCDSAILGSYFRFDDGRVCGEGDCQAKYQEAHADGCVMCHTAITGSYYPVQFTKGEKAGEDAKVCSGAPASGGCACLDSWNALEADKCLVCKEPILAGFYPVDDGKVCDGEGCIDKYTQR